MGCGGSKAPEQQADVTLVHDAKGAYAMAEADKIVNDGKEQLKGMVRAPRPCPLAAPPVTPRSLAVSRPSRA